jgi:hypothetical protein
MLAAAAEPTARAQDAAVLSQARGKFRQGVALEAAGDWQRALATFKEVALVKSTPRVRFHVAQCEEKTGDYVQALGSYRLALQEAREGNAKDVLAAAQEALAGLEPRVPKLTITRGDGAAVAEITLDGANLGAGSVGAAIPTNPGPHTLKAAAPGREPFSVELTLADRETKTIELVMVPLKQAASAAPITASPPVRDEPQPSHDGPSLMRTAGFIVGGVGVASLSVAGLFFAMRQSAISDLDAQCGANRQSCPPDAKPRFDQGKTYATVSTATALGGIGALAIGGVLVIAAPSRIVPTTGSEINRFGVWKFEPGAAGTATGATVSADF